MFPGGVYYTWGQVFSITGRTWKGTFRYLESKEDRSPVTQGMQIGYIALDPTHHRTQFFRPFRIFFLIHLVKLNYVMYLGCFGSMFWRDIVAVGCSVHPKEKYTAFQLEWITMPISDTDLPSTPKFVYSMEEVECHLRGPLRINTLVPENLKKYIFLHLMPNSVPLLNFII